MKRLILFFIFIAFASMYACDKDNTPPQSVKTGEQGEDDNKGDDDIVPDNTIPVSIPHYIMGVVETNSYRALVSDDDLTVHILFDTSDNRKYGFWYEIKKPDSEEANAYVAFCERYGDTTYDKERYYHIGEPYMNFYPMDNIVSIRIESIASYDAEHPAGTSLNDLCTLYSATPRQYIADGYIGEFDWDKASDEFVKYSRTFRHDDIEGSIPFAKPLAECTPEDLELIGNGNRKLCILSFKHKPETKNSRQAFKITLTDEKGKTYIAETELCEWK